MSDLKKEFGVKATIPKNLEIALHGYKPQVFQRDGKTTLYFPDVLDNQTLTKIYDRVSEHYPDSFAGLNRHNMRYIEIRTTSPNARRT